MWIVIAGNVADGLQFYGPFQAVETANWIGEFLQDEWITVELVSVDQMESDSLIPDGTAEQIGYAR